QLGSDEGMYFVVVAFVVVIAVAIAVLTETRLGKLLRAMGDSPVALDTYGVNVNMIRVLVFCISAFIAAVAGALSASVNTYAIGDEFPSFSSLTLLAIVIVVVLADPWYAFVAAAGLTIIPVYLTGGNVVNVILAVSAAGAVLVPVFRHRLQATPPRALPEVADRIRTPPPRRPRAAADQPTPAQSAPAQTAVGLTTVGLTTVAPVETARPGV